MSVGKSASTATVSPQNEAAGAGQKRTRVCFVLRFFIPNLRDEIVTTHVGIRRLYLPFWVRALFSRRFVRAICFPKFAYHPCASIIDRVRMSALSLSRVHSPSERKIRAFKCQKRPSADGGVVKINRFTRKYLIALVLKISFFCC